MRDYIRLVQKRWRVVVAATLLGAMCGVVLILILPSQYTARVTLFVSAQNTDSANALYQGALLSRDRVASYSELATSSRVLGEVASTMKSDKTPEQLATQITASSEQNSVLIDIDARDDSPESAAALADSVGNSLTGVIDGLERPSDTRTPPQISVRVVQPAAVPTQPSSVNGAALVALGIVTGAVLGVGYVLARNYLDTSVRTAEDLRSIVARPALATIPVDDSIETVLSTDREMYARSAEAYKALRTNLQFIDVDNSRRVLLVTSSLPGEGKTTTLVNLALALSAAGHRVIIVDADLRRPRVAEMLGLEQSIGLTTVLSSRINTTEAIQRWPSGPVDVLASGALPPNPSELLSSQQMKLIISKLANSYDYVLIDSPPLLPVTDAASLAPAADGVMLVCRYRAVSKAQLASAVESLEAVSATVYGTVFNAVPQRESGSDRYYAYYRYESSTGSSSTTPRVIPNSTARVDSDQGSAPRRPVPHRRVSG